MTYPKPRESIGGTLDRIEALLVEIKAIVSGEPAPAAQLEPVEPWADRNAMQARADYNREHAAELYSEALRYDVVSGRWITRDSGRLVVFTMYGWITEDDMNENMRKLDVAL